MIRIPIFLCLIATIGSVYADRFYVDTNAAPGGDGSSWATAFQHLQDALDQTVAGRSDDVWIAAGTYYPDDGASVTGGDRLATFTMKGSVELYGGFAGTETDTSERDLETNITTLSGEIFAEQEFWSLHVVTVEGDAVINGLTITKGNANGDAAPHDSGGGIYVGNIVQLALESVTISECHAERAGGGIYANSSIQLELASVTVTECVSERGGGLYFNESSNIVLQSSAISGCTAIVSGGAIYLKPSLTPNSTIASADSTFSYNKAPDGAGLFFGQTDASFADCKFINNDGTAIKDDRNSNIFCEDTEFTDNAGKGIATRNHSQIQATRCSFVRNSGGVYIRKYNNDETAKTHLFKECIFLQNTGGGIDGDFEYYSVSIFVIDSHFEENRNDIGGAIKSDYVKAIDSVFISNRSLAIIEYDSSGGGAIFAFSGSIENCTFESNDSASDGGAIHGRYSSIKDCEFKDNSAARDGGALFYGTLIKDCSFENNRAGEYGGAVSTSGNVTNSIFSENTAANGGAIRLWSRGEPLVTNNLIVGNSASNQGGAIHSENNEVVLQLNTFLYNSADSTGQTLWLNGQTVVIDNLFWHPTTPATGDLIYLSSDAVLTNIISDFLVPGGDAKNILAGGLASIGSAPEASILLGDTSQTIIDSDPLFVDESSPIGLDDTWGTADDGFRLQATSPAIGLGSISDLPNDHYDLDIDGDKTELLPIDLAGFNRVQDGSLDLGAYEFGNSSVPQYALITSADSGGSVSPVGNSTHLDGDIVALTATPDAGYLFEMWTGDATGSDNPLDVTMDADKTITATFGQDMSDADEDTLTAYQELVVYGTNPNEKDTNGDGIEDGLAVNAALDPTEDYSDVFDVVVGIVQDDPTSYNLFSDESVQDVRFGSMILKINEVNSVEFEYSIQISNDLGGWTNFKTVNETIPAFEGKEFIRFMSQEAR